MMISSSHHTREQFEHCLAAIRQASVEILLLLNVHVSEGKIHAGFWSNWIAPAWGWAGGAL